VNTASGPRISIVTPSFNQVQFLGDTIRSVLCQGYPNLEYIVVDGGSTDGSVELIRRYEKQLSSWVSEPDGGQYDAINKGFSKSSGEIMAWINSDDMYLPWAFQVVADIFASCPEIRWLTSIAHMYWDEAGRAVHCSIGEGFNRMEFYRGRNGGALGYERCYVMQESTFWRRELWDTAGGCVDGSLDLAGDFELWARFWQHADLYSTTALLSGFRIHGAQKTATKLDQYREEARSVLGAYGSRLPGRVEGRILRGARFLPFLKPLCGWKARVVSFDHQSARWITGDVRFL
jgi:glycosyltransferase involved in cell wall biosynthesis